MDPPKKLKHYELLERLGQGGMGVVYRARDVRLGRLVALKVLPHELAADADRSRRFEREARIASAISHPCIAHLYDVDRDGDTAFLTMELVSGPTLREVLAQGALPIDDVLDCGVQVVEALEAAHRAGIIHRDLKPENVMRSESGYYKVLDFGVARFDAEEPAAGAGSTRTPTRTWATSAGALVGTVAYMSPEQALGQPVDARSDIFSAGCLLYELATGRQPFRGPNEIAVAQALTSAEPEPLSSLRADAPAGLALVVARCLAKQPADRYPSATELLEDLRTLRFDSQVGTRGGARLHAQIRAPRRRRGWLLAGGLAAAGVALVAALVGLRGTGPAPGPGVPADAGPPTPPAPAGPRGPQVAARDPGRPRVIVAFFENNTGADDARWLAEALPEMLTTDLSRSEGLEVIATQRLYDLLATAGRGDRPTLDRSTTAELARWAGADLVISGSVFQLGERYRLDAQAYDTATGAVTVAHKVEGSDLFRLVDELTSELRRSLVVGSAAPAPEPPVRTTASEAAYRRFLHGQELYDGLRFREAADEFRQALSLDPGFARARLRLAMSLRLSGDQEAARELIRTVTAETDGLSEVERLLALGLRAWLVDGDLEAGQGFVSRLLEQFPGDNEARVWWARAARELAGDPLQAVRQLRIAMERDPNYLPAIVAMAEQLAEVGSVEDAAEIVREAVRRNPRAEAALGPVLDDLTAGRK